MIYQQYLDGHILISDPLLQFLPQLISSLLYAITLLTVFLISIAFVITLHRISFEKGECDA